MNISLGSCKGSNDEEKTKLKTQSARFKCENRSQLVVKLLAQSRKIHFQLICKLKMFSQMPMEEKKPQWQHAVLKNDS